MTENLKILLVGCGKMGGALLKGFVREKVVKASNVTVIDPYANFTTLGLKVKCYSMFKEVPLKDRNFDFCIIAVKPQSFAQVLPEYKGLKKCCFISIAAGKSIKNMAKVLGAKTPIARAMPNLPAEIGAGITGIYLNEYVSKTQAEIIDNLFYSVGPWVGADKESTIDRVTALTGSGPAYVFYLMEVIQKIAEKQGFDKRSSLVLAKQLVYGSAKLALSTERTPKELRTDVTSPGGTTEAALKVLMGDNKLENLFRDAIKAAIKRAKELQ